MPLKIPHLVAQSLTVLIIYLGGTGGDLSRLQTTLSNPHLGQVVTFPERKKETDKPKEGWDEDSGSPPARAGFWKDDQGTGTQGNGSGEWGAHRDTEGKRERGWAGRVHPHDTRQGPMDSPLV